MTISTPTFRTARKHSKWTVARVGFIFLQGLLVCLLAFLILGLLNQNRKFGIERVTTRLSLEPGTASLLTYLNAHIERTMSREQVESILGNLGVVNSKYDQKTVIPVRGEVLCDHITLTFPPDEWPIFGPIPGSGEVWTLNACYDPPSKLDELQFASRDSDSPRLHIR